MLNINPDTICRLIDLAKHFHVQEEVVIPDDPAGGGEDWARQVLAAHGSDTTVQEFSYIIRDLEPDQRHEVVALMWLGRGDFACEEWKAAVDHAADNATPATAQYLIAHPLLAEYLTEGLRMFGLNCDGSP
jgi:hypothetical protein